MEMREEKGLKFLKFVLAGLPEPEWKKNDETHLSGFGFQQRLRI